MADIFISYSHKDKQITEKIELELQKHNFDVWRDNRLDFGSEFKYELLHQIRNSDIFIVIMSTNSSSSEWVTKEIDFANNIQKPIVPILISGEKFPSLANLHYIDMQENISIPPKLIAQIKELLNREKSAESEINSLTYYVEELEEALSNIVNAPIISEILDYRRKQKLLLKSIEMNLNPEQAPFDIHQADTIFQILDSWQDLYSNLFDYAGEIENNEATLRWEIEKLVHLWEDTLKDNPDANSLPESTSPPKNYPSHYKSDLFSHNDE